MLMAFFLIRIFRAIKAWFLRKRYVNRGRCTSYNTSLERQPYEASHDQRGGDETTLLRPKIGYNSFDTVKPTESRSVFHLKHYCVPFPLTIG